MKDFFRKIIGSLDTHSKDVFSARKLSAAIVILMVVIAHIKWFKSDRWEYLGEVLTIDFTFIALCLGLTTWEAIKNKQIQAGVKDEKIEQ